MKKIAFIATCSLLLNFNACNKTAPIENEIVEPVKEAVPEILQETEPNNKYNEATPINIGLIGQGKIAVEEGKTCNDVDWWQFAIDERSEVSITISGLEKIDLAFSVHSEKNPSDAIIKAYSNTDGEKEKLAKLGETYPNLTLEPGKYYIKVFQFKKNSKVADICDNENFYNLKVVTNKKSEDTETEPNERYIDASPIRLGETKYGYFAVKSDSDWWKLDIGDGGTDPIGVKIILKSPEKVKPSLSIKNDIDAVIKEIGAMKDGGETIIIPDFVYTPNLGQLYLEVNSRWSHNVDEKYSLSIEKFELDTQYEIESNDRPVEATPINSDMFIRGFIDQGKILDKKPWRKADEDWYRITNNEEQAMTFIVSGLDEVNLVLGIYNNDGTENLITVDENDKREGEVISPIKIKDALIKVSAKNSTQFNPDQPYELQIKPYTITKPIESEPNNSKEKASILKEGPEGEIMGWIHPSKDIDFYRFNVEEDGKFNFKITGIPVVPLKVKIINVEGTEIAVQENSMDKDPVNLTTDLINGVYYCVVERGGKKEVSNPRDAYQISVTREN